MCFSLPRTPCVNSPLWLFNLSWHLEDVVFVLLKEERDIVNNMVVNFQQLTLEPLRLDPGCPPRLHQGQWRCTVTSLAC